MSAEELTLVPFTAGHYEILSSWFADERELVQWGGAAIHHPLDTAQLEGMLPRAPAQLAWMAVHDGDLVGHVQLMGIKPATGVVRVSRVAIAPEHRGRGLAMPMLTRVLCEAFAIPGIERATLGVYTWNAPAIATYERLGFRRGPITRASVHVGEDAWDLLEMAVSRDAFRGAA